MKMPTREELAARVVTKSPPDMPQPEKTADGRLGYPGIVKYLYAGKYWVCPPLDETPFKIVVIDDERYRVLEQTGFVYGLGHSGRKHTEVIDQRKAPGV